MPPKICAPPKPSLWRSEHGQCFVGIDHYENFPVASWLCPRRIRPGVTAIYRYARTADDIADEGTATAEERLADLRAYRADLRATMAGTPPSARWLEVFEPLRRAVVAHALPADLLADLLDAFEQDVIKHRYADRAELLEYCRRSANPVGRLLLHLYGVRGAQSLQQADNICTALQLTNFWQDLGVDIARGRLYIPLADCERHRVDTAELRRGRTEPGTQRLIAELVGWTRELMWRGAPLARTLPGSAGWELRFVVQGGLRILEKIERGGFAALRDRPVLRWYDAPRLGWRAVRMRPRHAAASRKTA